MRNEEGGGDGADGGSYGDEEGNGCSDGSGDSDAASDGDESGGGRSDDEVVMVKLKMVEVVIEARDPGINITSALGCVIRRHRGRAASMIE